MNLQTAITYLDTPIGLLQICADAQHITQVDFVSQRQFEERTSPLCLRAKQQLQEYFDGQRHDFDLPLRLSGTAFQNSVWQQLGKIGYGETCSYGDIANRLENPKAVRAVGAANGKNKIAIIIPCHRVIGANGTLTGYAGGLDRKSFLLSLEQEHCN